MWDRYSKFASNEQFYAFIDAITERLRSHDFISDADRLHALVHETAWTTSTEVFGEIQTALKQIRHQRADLDSNLSADIHYAIKAISRALRR
jgi:hypothetical protein